MPLQFPPSSLPATPVAYRSGFRTSVDGGDVGPSDFAHSFEAEFLKAKLNSLNAQDFAAF